MGDVNLIKASTKRHFLENVTIAKFFRSVNHFFKARVTGQNFRERLLLMCEFTVGHF
jgi:hypothetical protein